MALADGYANDARAALAHLRRAADLHPTDPDVVRQVARNFDRLQQFDESQKFLESVAAGDRADVPIVLTLVRRLWQDGRYADVLDRLAKVEAKLSAKSGPAPFDAADPELRAFRALALYGLGRGEEAKPVAQSLADDADPRAKAWGRALLAQFDPKLSPTDRIEQLRRSLGADRGNGIFYDWIADAYASQGETELALRYWQSAADAAPSWAAPLVRASQALLNDGRVVDADRLARAAGMRARSLEVSVNVLLVGYRRLELDPKNTALADDLLDRVERLQKAIPGEPNTLPIYAALLARTGSPDRAKGVIRAAIDAGAGDPMRLALASVSREFQLGLAPALVDRPAAEMTPGLALAQAKIASDTQKPDQVLAKLRKLAADHGNAAEWQLAVARWLEASGDPGAADAWAALGDGFPRRPCRAARGAERRRQRPRRPAVHRADHRPPEKANRRRGPAVEAGEGQVAARRRRRRHAEQAADGRGRRHPARPGPRRPRPHRAARLVRQGAGAGRRRPDGHRPPQGRRQPRPARPAARVRARAPLPRRRPARRRADLRQQARGRRRADRRAEARRRVAADGLGGRGAGR